MIGDVMAQSSGLRAKGKGGKGQRARRMYYV